MALNKIARRKRIHRRIRGKISGSAQRPRLVIYRSNKHIYAQLVDDLAGSTLVTYSSKEKDFNADGNKTDVAKEVGKGLASKAKDAGIESVVFDRNGYLYHGRVKSLAEGAREGGLSF